MRAVAVPTAPERVPKSGRPVPLRAPSSKIKTRREPACKRDCDSRFVSGLLYSLREYCLRFVEAAKVTKDHAKRSQRFATSGRTLKRHRSLIQVAQVAENVPNRSWAWLLPASATGRSWASARSLSPLSISTCASAIAAA